ncbi:MAG: redoxin domain-containing protein, partial [Bacteroidales bacterium]|nr:redoxin domain-containing protein [Bacteroidales bacterium]
MRRTISRIEAVIDDIAITRVHQEGNGKMKWDTGDQIGVFSDAENPVRFRMDGDNIFVCDDGQSVSGQAFYAFYPYSDQAFQADNRKVLSVTGGAAEGRNNPAFTLPMVAKSDGSSLSFKQTCGVLHFSLTGSNVLKSVLLEANGGESIYGTGTIDLAEDTPVFKIGSGSPAFALTLANPVLLSKSNPYSVWFGLPPGTLSQGFTLTMEYGDGSVKKSTDKAVTIKRATQVHYTVNIDQVVEETETALEREALVALYNAMDGPHWVNSTNWCSDKPLSEWYGVYMNGGRVTDLILEFNGLNGALPTELSNLKSLRSLSLVEREGRISNMEALFGLSALESLTFGIGEGFSDYEVYKSRMFAVPSGIGNLKKLKYVYLTGINDDLPDDFFELEGLEQIYLRRFNTGRPLQSGFGKMKSLKVLSINCISDKIFPDANPVCGELPDSIYDLAQLEFLELVDTNVGGELSPRIGELKHLNGLKLPANQFSGPLPAELSNLELMAQSSMRYRIDLHNNHFSGKIPEAFRNWPEWHQNWGYIVSGNNFEFTEVMPSIPSFETTTIDGKRISSEMVKDHELTLLFQSASWCPFSPAIVSELKDIYPTYKDKGLEVFCYSAEDENTVKAFADTYGFSWPTFVNVYGPDGQLPPLGIDYYPINSIPSVTIFDRSGRLVYYQFGADGSLTEFIESQLGDGVTELYESADYSADGTVHTLQTATNGAGIDIVLMGDGYSDRLITDG